MKLSCQVLLYYISYEGEIIITTFDHMFFVNKKGFELALS